jgi:collagenase-like PrtC family protease
MAVGAISGKQNYEVEDLKFLDELSKLNSEIDKARIEGRYKDVAAGKEAVKDLIADKKQAEQSGTSLLNTKENVRSREQIALDNRLSREQTARDAAASRAQIAAAQAEGKKAERQQRQQNWIAEQERKWQDTLGRNSAYKDAVTQRSMYERLLNMSTDPKTQEKAQAGIDAQNEKIAKMLPTAGGAAANIPPPPPGAVRETVKKS